MAQRMLFLLLALLAVAGCRRQAAAPPSAPAGRNRVVIISIDGLRPDVALRADMPNLRQLMRHGSFSFWARTTELSNTLPSHTSMLTGIAPNRHEVYWNYDMPYGQTFRSPYPSVIDLARQAGYTTAMCIGKSKLRAIAREESVDYAYIPDGYAQASQVAAEAGTIIRRHRPDLLFAHFPDVDATGHGASWGGEWQIKAAASADQGIGVILAALREAGVLGQTTVFVTSDHGGSGNSHGPDDVRSRHIPWVVSGPNTRAEHDLTQQRDLNVNIEDTFATACWLLDLPMPEDIDGKPITGAFNDPPPPPVELTREMRGRR